MATLLKNYTTSNLGTSESTIFTTGATSKTTVIGLSFTNLTASIVLATCRLVKTATSSTAVVTNVLGNYTLTNISDAAAAAVEVGYTVSGTGITTGSRVVSKTQLSTNNNTITLDKPTTSAVTSATFVSSAYFMKDVIIPPNQSLRAINGGEKLIMDPLTEMKVTSTIDGSMDVIVSYAELV